MSRSVTQVQRFPRKWQERLTEWRRHRAALPQLRRRRGKQLRNWLRCPRSCAPWSSNSNWIPAQLRRALLHSITQFPQATSWKGKSKWQPHDRSNSGRNPIWLTRSIQEVERWKIQNPLEAARRADALQVSKQVQSMLVSARIWDSSD